MGNSASLPINPMNNFCQSCNLSLINDAESDRGTCETCYQRSAPIKAKVAVTKYIDIRVIYENKDGKRCFISFTSETTADEIEHYLRRSKEHSFKKIISIEKSS